MDTVIFKVQKEEEGFSAHAVSLPIFTQGDTLEELVANIKDSLACHFNNTSKTDDMIKAFLLVTRVQRTV